MNLIITCLLVFVLQIIASLLRVNEIKYCYNNNKHKMITNALYGSVVALVSFTIGISPLIRIFDGHNNFEWIDILAPLSFVAGAVIGKWVSTLSLFNK